MKQFAIVLTAKIPHGFLFRGLGKFAMNKQPAGKAPAGQQIVCKGSFGGLATA
jgi:hypothetical protein